MVEDILQTIPEVYRGLFSYNHKDEPETFIERQPSFPDYNSDSSFIRLEKTTVVDGFVLFFDEDDTKWLVKIESDLEEQIHHLIQNANIWFSAKHYKIENCKVVTWTEETNR
jgi:hypothetical protein